MNYLQGLIDMGVDGETAAKFMRYHRSHNWLWPEFERRALAEVEAGKTRISSKAIAEDMRKAVDREGDPFGIDNRFPSYYARIFILKYPHLSGRIELRRLTGVTSGENNYALARSISNNSQAENGVQTVGVAKTAGGAGPVQRGTSFVQQALLEPPRQLPAIYSENA